MARWSVCARLKGTERLHVVILYSMNPELWLDFQRVEGGGNTPAVQWLVLHAPASTRGPGSIAGWGTKTPQAVWHSQIYIQHL